MEEVKLDESPNEPAAPVGRLPLDRRMAPLRISRRLMEALDRMAEREGLTRSQLVRQVLVRSAREAGEL